MYEIIYHEALVFRCAPIEMLLHDAGISFTKSAPQWAPNRCLGENTAGPCFAPPVLRECDTNFCVSQLPAIMEYLASVHGYLPTDKKDAAVSLQILLDIADVGSELFAAGKNEETKATFVDGGRLTNWLVHLNKMFVARGSGSGGGFMGANLVGADFMFVTLMVSLDFTIGSEKLAQVCPVELMSLWRSLEARPFMTVYLGTNPSPILFESYKAK
jgi:hypothetical protein